MVLLSDVPDPSAPSWPGLDVLTARLCSLLDEDAALGAPILLAGDWGSGKTTLLMRIRDFLDGTTPGHCVWFEAWRYEGTATLLPGLVRTVLASSPHAQVKSQSWQALRAAAAVALRMAPGVALALGGPAAAAGSAMIENLISFKELGEEVEDTLPGDPVDVLRRRLGTVLEEGWGNRPPTILIDDLDRCAPDRAIELIEQIRAILAPCATPLRCRVVIALDRELLVRAVTRKFQGINGYDGNRYLEKVFPLAIAVPGPPRAEARSLVRALTTSLERDDRAVLIEELGEPEFANPRLMKRCVNRYVLLRRFEGDERPAEVRTMVRWIAASERWSGLRRLMYLHADDYWVRLGEHLHGRLATLDDVEAMRLLAERGAREWLRNKLFPAEGPSIGPFRAADARLRACGL